MAAYEQSRLLFIYFFPSSRVVVARVPTDVRHVNAHTFALPVEVLHQLRANLLTIDVSEHAACRLERLQAVQYFYGTEIAGVPNLIALFKVNEHGLVQKTMRVGQQADLHPYRILIKLSKTVVLRPTPARRIQAAKRLRRKRISTVAIATHLVRSNQEWALDFACDMLATGRGFACSQFSMPLREKTFP
jgi:hypothetical protein